MLRWFVCGGTNSQALLRQLSQGESFFVPPQSLRDSSPKGTPFGAAAKFPATTEAVPLGKVAANAVSRRKGYHGKRFCLRESLQNPMKKYTQIA